MACSGCARRRAAMKRKLQQYAEALKNKKQAEQPKKKQTLVA